MNSILNAFNLYKTYFLIAAVVFVLGSEFVYVRGVYVNEGNAKVAALKADYDARAAKLAEELHAKEQKLNEVNQELEKQNVDAKKKIDAANKRYAQYVAAHGLRDPGVQTRPGAAEGGNSGTSGESSGSCQNRELSVEASGFLLGITKEADELAADYKTCYDWATKVREIMRSRSSSVQQ